MTVKYLIRLDDAHPRMQHQKWKKIEDICLKFDVKPIVAVIPDNKDEDLNHSSFDEKFWSNLHYKQNIGWTIALHGYQHKLRPSDKGLVPINRYSEFIGFDVISQSSMIAKGCKILQEYNLKPEVWVAPAHGLDKLTIESLIQSSDIRVISDGLSIRPFSRFGIHWIPQQLWRPRNMWFGTWTICLHPSEMTQAQIESIANFIKTNKQHIVGVNNISFSNFSFVDWFFQSVFGLLIMMKKGIKTAVKHIRSSDNI